MLTILLVIMQHANYFASDHAVKYESSFISILMGILISMLTNIFNSMRSILMSILDSTVVFVV
jgi:hypothetical protein